MAIPMKYGIRISHYQKTIENNRPKNEGDTDKSIF